MNTDCYNDFITELLTVVLRSLKLCDCRWRFRSGCMNSLRYKLCSSGNFLLMWSLNY